jgi:uncharacterized membrane protein YkoI
LLINLKRKTEMTQNTIFNAIYKRHLISLLAITALAFSLDAAAYTGQKLAGDAKVSMEQAQVIALKAHPGKITDRELEKEEGGSGLRYSFDILNGKVTQEVGVDAATGAVLEDKAEGKNAD